MANNAHIVNLEGKTVGENPCKGYYVVENAKGCGKIVAHVGNGEWAVYAPVYHTDRKKVNELGNFKFYIGRENGCN